MNNVEKQKALRIKKNLDFLWECTREMNAYFQIIQNIIKNKSSNTNLISISPTFYHYTYNALILATFSEVSRIYDRKSNTNFFKFIENCKENRELLLKMNEENLKEVGGSFDFDITVTSEYIDENLDCIDQRLWEFEITFKHLKTQRDRIYAHNESKSFETIKTIIEKNSNILSDMKALITFTTETLEWLYTVIAQKHCSRLPINIDDLDNTLIVLKSIFTSR